MYTPKLSWTRKEKKRFQTILNLTPPGFDLHLFEAPGEGREVLNAVTHKEAQGFIVYHNIHKSVSVR